MQQQHTVSVASRCGLVDFSASFDQSMKPAAESVAQSDSSDIEPRPADRRFYSAAPNTEVRSGFEPI